jgi:hypothetical protein
MFIHHALRMTANSELAALREDLAALLVRVDSMLDQPADDLVMLQRTVAIQRVLRSKGPLRPTQIARELHAGGRDDPDHVVQVTTQNLWSRGRIVRLAPGLYAPLGWSA